MATRHAKVSVRADGVDPNQIQPSDWNDEHVGSPFNDDDVWSPPVVTGDVAGNTALDSLIDALQARGVISDGTSSAVAPVITAVSATPISSTSITIAWTTSQSSTSETDYGLTTDYTGGSTLNNSLVISHSVTIAALSPSTLYHYRVRSTNASGVMVQSGDYTVTTLSSGADTTPPVISNVATSSLTANTVRVTWDLDEFATGVVRYGLTASYGLSSVAETSFAYDAHNIQLNSLTPGTLYHYKVESQDASGNLASSSDFTFTTPSILTISNVAASSITSVSAVISWNLSDFGTGQVEYGVSTSYGSLSTLEPSFSYNFHSQSLSGLTPGTLYHYRVRSQNASGVLAISADGVFTTSAVAVLAPYGSSYAADALNNSRVGYGGWSFSYRFRASQSSALNSFKVYIIANGNTGYSNGTGGTLRVDLYADNGTAHHDPTGASLANASIVPGNPGTVSGYPFPTFTFGSPYTLVAGTLYHLVFTNTDGSPTVNYVSLDGTYSFDEDVPMQPKFLDVDFDQLIRVNAGAWKTRLESGDGGIITPVLNITYANGSRQGQGYMETWGGGGSDGYNTCNGTIRLRETFTVTGGNRTFNRISVRIARTSGNSPLTVALETSGGSAVGSISIPSASIATASKNVYMNGQHWVSGVLTAPVTITNGSSYNLILSTLTGTEYWLGCIRKGSAYGFSSSTYYNDGNAQIATTGSNWANVKALTGSPSNQADIQFYFSTV